MRTGTNICVFSLAIAWLPAATHAQGTFIFRNYFPGQAAPVFDMDCRTPLIGAAYVAQAYVGVTPEQLQPLDPIVPFTTGGFLLYGPTVTVPGIVNQTVYVQMRAWASAAGSTYEAAASSGGKHGFSNIIPIKVQPNTTGSLLDETRDFESFCLIPEPPAWALGFLGVMGAWLVGRFRPARK